jgi:hypothetical protein
MRRRRGVVTAARFAYIVRILRRLLVCSTAIVRSWGKAKVF